MVKHILKDGTVLDDITGHVVKMRDAPNAYTLLDAINQSNYVKRKDKENEHD